MITNETKPILLIDGYHLLHKGYYGTLKRTIVSKNKDGIVINAIYSFVANILKFVQSDRYHSVIVAFDFDENCWRKELYSEYKAKRKPTPIDLIPQLQIARDFLTSANISWYEKYNYEGDDVIGSICRIANKLGYDVCILTNDKDIYQLVNNKTSIITNISKKEKIKIIKSEQVYEHFLCQPNQVADIKAILGDQSDNIKGVKYIKRKQAESLINKYENVENILDHINELNEPLKTIISENKQLIIDNKKITKILTNVKLGRINFKPTKITYYRLIRFLKEQEMYAFIRPIRKYLERTNKKTVNK
ncbi:5'-3' exonuclease [Mycoplasma mycoides subsp. mycoides]|uniref:5'-3' exonuclease n=2 Tax=Mycoplasma mycoides subsp. mycoides TaxID=2103 RepID=Q6MUE1_MYCMS|nr:5'-3' exonuclease [Mycoplasma mycoides]CAE76743.1 DNA POLYMERASE I, 5'-3' exonuclease [Mycoplasma mycoides subsp. mycoides SC str. PG1]ADK69985.1 5'-3' exonuclease, SAM domain protein [Mycoplasma mycoides subsp. mycoides SC str. Gladysdale]AIZ54923.1 5'-3' exonuclease, exo domain of DNA polymerase I [Mycoplasma mycoides subsp. mycoides]AME10298.1 DNA polymerase I, 5'-3' exonuclease [Mycoplasma mycoides subsp. mycoides]AME11303.1 DNA polymerase I, 5'-3' exonuclease [Mycoplasma mycoides subsp